MRAKRNAWCSRVGVDCHSFLVAGTPKIKSNERRLPVIVVEVKEVIAVETKTFFAISYGYRLRDQPKAKEQWGGVKKGLSLRC
jgi:hypothetical protein